MNVVYSVFIFMQIIENHRTGKNLVTNRQNQSMKHYISEQTFVLRNILQKIYQVARGFQPYQHQAVYN